jgi:hypothetical protein
MMDDNALIATYQQFDTPVDQFVGNPDLAEAFVAAVHALTGIGDLDAQEVERRLVYLRKKGRLPRLRRAYHGRNGNSN